MPTPNDNVNDDLLLKLLRRSGRRVTPPDDVTQRLYTQSLDAWTDMLRARRRRRWGLAMAASLILATTVAWLWLTPRSASEFGTVSAAIANGSGARKVFVGERLSTGASGLRILTASGTEIFVDKLTQVHLVDMDRLQLASGQIVVYADRAGPAPKPLLVTTDFGDVQHLGTRFLVGKDQNGLTVAVRDGLVSFTTPAATRLMVQEGERLEVDRSGRAHLDVIDPFDALWQWSDALNPPIALEGRSLDAVLTEIAKRAGLRLAYRDRAAAATAQQTILHGPMLSITSRQALDAALASTTLTATQIGRNLTIQKR